MWQVTSTFLLWQVVLEEGQMLFYESAKCAHGRPKPRPARPKTKPKPKPKAAGKKKRYGR